ncbi:hypothetical protein ARNL5_01741 [Anaerolineae bacterium]|nr:hypothetical protein ARNL5_01741 [Anaerolineae bacterium]
MLMKNIRIHRSDKKLLSHQLRLQLDVLKECILMFEQGDSCIEIIKRIQSVESALSAANAQLVNIHLTKCLAALSNLASIDEALYEVSGLYGCLDRLSENAIDALR